MFEAMTALAERSVMERVVLLVNHVLRAEPVASARLAAHAGRTISVSFARWPVLLPALPSFTFRVTPAGLVEWIEQPGDVLADGAADLRIAVDAGNPAAVLAHLVIGERPKVDVEGDPAFAADALWLIDNLRWDLEEDLARIVGDAPARAIAKVASAVVKGLREASRAIDAFAGRGAADTGGAPKGPASP